MGKTQNHNWNALMVDLYNHQNCGAEIPRWICKRLEGYADDSESIRKFGIEVVTQLCETLIESGAPGIHFYSMNQTEPTLTICKNLGL